MDLLNREQNFMFKSTINSLTTLKFKIMKKITLVVSALLMLAFVSVNDLAAQNYSVDTKATTVNWLGEKVTGEHNGTINLKSGNLEMKDAKIKSGTFVMDMNSIVCLDLTDPEYNGKLVGHLKSDDFFGVADHPTATLVVTSTESFSKGFATVKGNLTIKGITQPVEFKATMSEDPEGLRFFANITIDRSKFNVKYGSGSFFDNLGDKTIYDEFKLKVNLLAKKS